MMGREVGGTDYTLPAAEFERVHLKLYRFIGGAEEVEIINTFKNGRMRIRFDIGDTLPGAQELDDILRDVIKIKSLRRATYYVPKSR